MTPSPFLSVAFFLESSFGRNMIMEGYAKVSKRSFIWKLYLVLGVFLIWSPCPAGAQQDCVIATPAPIIISETQAAGASLLNLTGGPAASWSVQIKKPAPPASASLDPYFSLQQAGGNATLSLRQTLDLEVINAFLKNDFTLEFTIKCSQTGSPDMSYQLFLIITPVNEFEPRFVRIPEGGFNISEAKKVGDVILTLQEYVEDKDVVLNHPGYDFTFLPFSDAAVDGRQKLSLGSRLTGAIVVSTALDYEAMSPNANYYMLNVTVGDRDGGAPKTSTQTIRLNILDADDQPPEFWYPGCSSPCFTYYSAAIADSFQGAVTWLQPAPIAARDLDSLGSRVTYRFKQGDPVDFSQYLTINSTSGVPSIVKPMSGSKALAIFAIVEAVEDTPLKHSQQTTLWLKVVGRNSTDPTLPPVIVVRPSQAASAFRIATIVLGVLFGLLLVLVVVFLVCSMSSGVKTSPVLPKAIGKLSSSEGSRSQGGGGRSPGSTRRKSRKSVTLAKSSGDGESRLDFMRSLSRPRGSVPTLRAYTPTAAEERNPDVEGLPVSREIEYGQNGMEEIDGSLHEQGPPISTISDSDLVPYEDRVGLVDEAEDLGEEGRGMSNPVYEAGDDFDVGVIPRESTINI